MGSATATTTPCTTRSAAARTESSSGSGPSWPSITGPPARDGLQLYVVADTPDVSGNPELFASGTVTLVLPQDAGPAPAGVAEMRAGQGGQVDLPAVVGSLAGRVLVAEGGPTLAGVLASLGLVDEFFLTLSPRVVAGTSGRVVHGPEADPDVWRLAHGFVDDDGFLFLRYEHQA